MFSFNSKKYDFWPLYERIKKFYPLGIDKNSSTLFRHYPGQLELESMIVDNVHNDDHFKIRWGSFTAGLSYEFNAEIVGTTYGQEPCFSAYLLIDSVEIGNCIRTKELHFFVSLIGPFYTIIGRDHNIINVSGQSIRSTNYLTVSPVDEYLTFFETVYDRIENNFCGYKFVPFFINAQILEGLDVRYSDENLNKIFHAVFNNHLDLTAAVHGDAYYKVDNWIKPGFIDNGTEWTSYPPLT